MAEVGLVLTLKDGATSGLKAMGSAAKSTLGSVRSVADKAKAAFGAMGSAMTGINQGLEIAKKAWGILQMAIGGTVSEALRFRQAGDPVLVWFSDMKRESELLRARIGDALIPVIKGLYDGLGNVGKGAAEWIGQNRKLIATRILEWVMKIGNVLIKSVAMAVLLVTKAWAGWQEIILLVQIAGNKMFEAILSGTAAVLGAMGKVAKAVGADGVSGTLDEAATAARDLSGVFSDTADANVADLRSVVAETEKLEKKINDLENKALTGWAEAGVKAQEEIDNSIGGTNDTIDEQIDKLDELAAKLEAFSNARIAMIQKRSDFELSIAQGLDDQLQEIERDRAEATQESIDSQLEAAQTALAITGEFIDDIVSGIASSDKLARDAQKAVAEGAVDAAQKVAEAEKAKSEIVGNAAKAMALSVIDAITAVIAGYAIEAAAAAFAAYAGIPVVGPIIGGIAAAAAGAVVMAIGAGLKALVSGLADGGVITGGVGGRDSVPAMLMPGEQVMSVGERQAMQKFMNRLLGAQAGQAAVGLVGSGTSGQPAGQSIVVNNNTELRTWTPQITEEMKMARQLEQRSRKKLAQQGMLMTQGARAF